MIRPYRLINASEMQLLNQHFSQVIQQWCDKYALNPLSFELKAPNDQEHFNNNISITSTENNTVMGLIEENYLDVVHYILFGEIQDASFNTINQDLFLLLLEKTFKVKACTMDQQPENSHLWFYKGSTCLLLILSSGEYKLRVLLDPEWVYQFLSTKENVKNKLDSLEDALANEVLDLNVVLLPLNLPLSHLLGIQAGDVLTTDHPIFTPLKFVHKEQIIAEGRLGQTESHKSLSLEGFS